MEQKGIKLLSLEQYQAGAAPKNNTRKKKQTPLMTDEELLAEMKKRGIPTDLPF